MEKEMKLDEYVSQIKYFIVMSRDERFSDNARSVLALHADALIKSYRVDDDWARLIK